MINLSIKLKQNVASCGSRMQKIGGLWMRAIKEPTFHQKMWGLWVTAEKISKNMGSLGDSSAENRGLWSLTSASPPIMGVPPPRVFDNIREWTGLSYMRVKHSAQNRSEWRRTIKKCAEGGRQSSGVTTRPSLLTKLATTAR